MKDKNENYMVALVYSTSIAVRAEKLCKKAGIKVKLIPTPRHLSSDCGIVLRFDSMNRDAVVQTLEDGRVDYDDIVPLGG